ncbi:membrane protein insertase YidC [Saccharopolyspora rectivirgula]|uniref:Membrane protein insertase YidC n=1 Tax=Saccharopolyspora rectivirgula TaxID=28042 RepID=A0A073BAA2_9PSEU|nr:membrane protein insertase YidC [Saccharopolyspora rectivirgula]KEI44669.1 preprotein translocase subunit YidC [Saccharopolyspora rectivirgula]
MDIIYYPVSAILWVWHKVFGSFLDPASGLAWALSVIFLVFTLRALLFKPFVTQVRSMKKMQKIAPLVRELQEKHGDDRQKLAMEMQKLQSEHGFNPLAGCLPVLVQVPVFIGLFHVLNGFKPGATSNYVFGAEEVASFVEADLFGAKLSISLTQPAEVLAAFGTDRTSMLLVAVPLMIAAAIATHFTARHSVARQGSQAAQNPQAAAMNRVTLWLFPMFAIVGGPFLPVAILIYWLANNFWTLGQQYVVYRKIDAEEAQDPSAPVVDSVATSGQDSDIEHQPGEVPGVIEDHNRGADKPGDSR